jgi:pentatricopeptide repeat protein
MKEQSIFLNKISLALITIEELPPSLVVFNTIIKAFVMMRHPDLALNIVQQMKSEGVTPGIQL